MSHRSVEFIWLTDESVGVSIQRVRVGVDAAAVRLEEDLPLGWCREVMAVVVDAIMTTVIGAPYDQGEGYGTQSA